MLLFCFFLLLYIIYFKSFNMKTNLNVIRWLLMLFIIALFISGLTAIPVEAQLSFLLDHLSKGTTLYSWIERVLLAYREVNTSYPAHLLLTSAMASFCRVSLSAISSFT